mmetsp:Transcript_97603/g.260498  ORF Transcript_97603/g.260498 Transcript_97603/m.260498 type:complete len:213 (-) Transcript_97603:414-1052(-)
MNIQQQIHHLRSHHKRGDLLQFDLIRNEHNVLVRIHGSHHQCSTANQDRVELVLNHSPDVGGLQQGHRAFIHPHQVRHLIRPVAQMQVVVHNPLRLPRGPTGVQQQRRITHLHTREPPRRSPRHLAVQGDLPPCDAEHRGAHPAGWRERGVVQHQTGLGILQQVAESIRGNFGVHWNPRAAGEQDCVGCDDLVHPSVQKQSHNFPRPHPKLH